MHGGETVFDEGAHSRELFLFVRRQILRRKFRVRDQDSLRSHFARRFHQFENFHAPEVQNQDDAEMTAIITKGKNKMPAYEKSLKDTQIKDLVAYTRALGKKK